MSFSSEVKQELVKQLSKSRHCQLAELAAILTMEGHVGKNPLTVGLLTENPLLAEKYAVLIKKAFSIDVSGVLHGEDAKRLLSAIRMEAVLKEENPLLAGRRTDGLLIQNTCCRRAFIRGAFLASGSISNPNKSYHLEIVCRSLEQAEQLKQLMNGFELDAKIVTRKYHEIVYLKEGAQVVDMLNVMEAYVSLMNLENVRILKEMRNSVNRKVNCETANISKTVNAAVRQIADIRKIQDTIGFEELSPTLREIALLRLEYPDLPLKDLGSYLDPPVGKSGVNHRLRKISAIAEQL